MLLLTIHSIFPHVPAPDLLCIEKYLQLQVFLLSVPAPPQMYNGFAPVPLLRTHASDFVLSCFLKIKQPCHILPFFKSSTLF